MQRAFSGLGCNRREAIIGVLFFKGGKHGAAVGAAGHTMNNELRHREPPVSNVSISSALNSASGRLFPDPSSARSALAGVSVRISQSTVRRSHGSGPD